MPMQVIELHVVDDWVLVNWALPWNPFLQKSSPPPCGSVSLSPSSASVRKGEKFNVALLGACGGIGQPLALLLKLSPRISELRLYDVAPAAGVAADLSHIDTSARITAHTGPEELSKALYGADLVVIPAGVPRKPGMTRDDLFNINAGIVRSLVEGVAKYCPSAWLAVISNPVNSTVPIAAETLKISGVYDPRRLFGVTTLDVVRANTFVGEKLGVQPEDVEVPVVGGHAGATIVPILSSSIPPMRVSGTEHKALTTRIQDAGTEVVAAKAGAGSATLSMAYAAARFSESCLRALSGEDGIVECAYVASDLVPDLPFLASPVRLGSGGLAEYLPLPSMTLEEKENFEKMKEELKKSIEKGRRFVNHRK